MMEATARGQTSLHPELELSRLRARVRAAAASAGLPSVAGMGIARTTSGASSLTYLVGDGTRTLLVVKVAPPGIEPVRNRDMLRQARILKALTPVVEVRVPEVLFEDPGEPPGIPPLFGMSFVQGSDVEPNLVPEDHLVPHSTEVAARVRHAIEMLAAMHSSTPGELGIDEAPVGPDHEVARWTRAFATVDPSLAEPAARVNELLIASPPAATNPVIVHGDYRLGNMLSEGGLVKAIIDWEIWSVSDRRIDLAWMLLNCDSSGMPQARRQAPGIPPRDELIALYEKVSGVAIDSLRWFDALVRYKQAAIGALNAKHRLKATGIKDEARHESARLQLADAYRILEQR